METAKLLTNENGQLVVLPAAFQFHGAEVYIKKVGNAIVLLNKNDPWQVLIESLDQFSDDFMETRKQPLLSDRKNL